MLGLQVEQNPNLAPNTAGALALRQRRVTVAAQEHRSPDYLARFIPRELKKWAVPIAASGASAD
jgi:hypothetical protein